MRAPLHSAGSIRVPEPALFAHRRTLPIVIGVVLLHGVALWALHLFREQLPARRWLAVQSWTAFGLLVAGFAGAGQLTTLAETHLYADEIVHAESTPYQRIVVTRWRDDLRLFLNNNLHVVHHMHPAVPWYRLPAVYRDNADHYRRRNDHYVYRNYAEIFRRYLFAAKDPVPHPLMDGHEVAEPAAASARAV